MITNSDGDANTAQLVSLPAAADSAECHVHAILCVTWLVCYVL